MGGVGRQGGKRQAPAAVVECGVDDQLRAIAARLSLGQVGERGGAQQVLGHDLGQGAGRQRRVEPAKGPQLAPEERALEVLAQFRLIGGKEGLYSAVIAPAGVRTGVSRGGF